MIYLMVKTARRHALALIIAVFHLSLLRQNCLIHSFTLKIPLIKNVHKIYDSLSVEITTSQNKPKRYNWIKLRVIPPIYDDTNYGNDEDDDNDRELVRANRRRTRQRGVNDEEWSATTYTDNSDKDFQSNDDNQFSNRQKVDEWDEFDFDDDNVDDDDDDDESDESTYDLLENIIIPNPLLDSIDPDGTIDRLPELLSDPRFWFDMVLFILFLDFLSFAGPQSDPFIDFPWFY